MLKKAVRGAASMLLASALGVGCRPAVTSETGREPQMADADLEAAVEAEVISLHAAFVRWFRGELPRTPAGMDAVTTALAPAFEIVTPSGHVADRDATLAGIEGAYGAWSADDQIEIRNVRVLQRGEGFVLASYEEWQVRGGENRGRLSTVAFTVEPGSPQRLQWLRVHETWLPSSTEG